MEIQQSPWRQLLRFLAIALLFLLLGSGGALLVSSYLVAYPDWVVRMVQLLSMLFLFILPPLVAAWWIGVGVRRYLSLQERPEKRWMLLVVLLVVALQPLIAYLADWNRTLHLPAAFHEVEVWMVASEASAEVALQLMLGGGEFSLFLFNLLVVSVMAGVGEELFFRGTLQRIFAQGSGRPIVSAIIIGILFSALHLQFFGFFPRALLGVLFGLLYHYGGSLWYPIVAHMLHNALGVTLYFLAERRLFTHEQLDAFAVTDYRWMVPISLTATLILLVTLYQKSKTVHSITP